MEKSDCVTLLLSLNAYLQYPMSHPSFNCQSLYLHTNNTSLHACDGDTGALPPPAPVQGFRPAVGGATATHQFFISETPI